MKKNLTFFFLALVVFLPANVFAYHVSYFRVDFSNGGDVVGRFRATLQKNDSNQNGRGPYVFWLDGNNGGITTTVPNLAFAVGQVRPSGIDWGSQTIYLNGITNDLNGFSALRIPSVTALSGAPYVNSNWSPNSLARYNLYSDFTAYAVRCALYETGQTYSQINWGPPVYIPLSVCVNPITSGAGSVGSNPILYSGSLAVSSFTLSLSAGAGGSVDPLEITDILSGSVVDLSPIPQPDEGYTFNGWQVLTSGGGTLNGNNWTMGSADASLRADFSAPTYQRLQKEVTALMTTGRGASWWGIARDDQMNDTTSAGSLWAHAVQKNASVFLQAGSSHTFDMTIPTMEWVGHQFYLVSWDPSAGFFASVAFALGDNEPVYYPSSFTSQEMISGYSSTENPTSFTLVPSETAQTTSQAVSAEESSNPVGGTVTEDQAQNLITTAPTPSVVGLDESSAGNETMAGYATNTQLKSGFDSVNAQIARGGQAQLNATDRTNAILTQINSKLGTGGIAGGQGEAVAGQQQGLATGTPSIEDMEAQGEAAGSQDLGVSTIGWGWFNWTTVPEPDMVLRFQY